MNENFVGFFVCLILIVIPVFHFQEKDTNVSD